MRRISTAAVARPRLTLAFFAVFVLVLAVLGRDLQSRLTPTMLVVKGTPSAHAADLYAEEFGDGITVPVLLEGPPAELDRQGPALVRKLRERPDSRVLSAWDRGPAGASLRPKPDSALIVIGIDRPLEQAVDKGFREVEDIVLASIDKPVEPHVTGLAAVGLGVKNASLDAAERAEKLAVPILLVVLLAVFRSLVAAAIPAVFGGGVVLAGMGGLSLLTRITDIDAIAVSLASMMGLALGVDYSLLLVSRFREELESRPPREAALTAAATAGRTVLFAGLVLAAAMIVALLLAPGDILISATMGVLVAVFVSVTIAAGALPAVLVLLGPNVDRGWIGRRRGAFDRRSPAVRFAAGALRRPLVPALLVLGVLMLSATPALALRTGPPDVRMLPKDSPVRGDFEAVRDVMGPGWTAPFEVVVRVREGTITERRRLEALGRWQRTVAKLPGVRVVVGPGAIAERLPDAAPGQLAQAGKQLARGKQDLKRLEDGLDRAGDGVGELRAGLDEAASAADRLSDGGDAAREGAARMRDGLARAAAGADAVVGGLRRARDGGGALERGARRTATGASELATKLADAQRRVSESLPKARELPAGLRQGAGDLGKLREPAQKTEAELRAALKALDGMTLGKADPRYKDAYTAVATALGAVSGKHPLTGQPVQPGYDGLDPSLARASGELGRAADGAGELVSGTERLATGLGELADGARRLRAGAGRVARGAERLEAGLRRLSSGGGELAGGLDALRAGADRLDGGLAQLAGGAERLRGGLESGGTRTAELRQGLEQGEQRVQRSGGQLVQADLAGLAKSARRSPGMFDSGYFTLAALDGSRGGDRAGAEFAVSLERGGQAGRIMVVPATGPNEAATSAVGERLRAALPDLERAVGDGEAGLGGAAAFLDDYDRATAGRFPWLVLAIVLVTFVVLVPVFRSLVLPALAIVLNLITVAAAFGILALLFQGDGPMSDAGFIDAISASGIFCTLFGLSIDYQVFLITRMREGWEITGSTTDAIKHGLDRTASVVTGAALIMLGVFSAFSLADVASIRQFGLGLAIAVLIDATVVRLVLLPAAMRLCGRWNWWLPAGLDRRLPRLAVD